MEPIVILDEFERPFPSTSDKALVPVEAKPIVKVEPDGNPLAILQMALEKGVDADQLGKLMALQERWEKNKAAEAFARAITDFQSQVPTVFKSRTADVQGKFTYKFASYEDIMAAAGPVLAKLGIVVTFSTEPAGEKAIKTTCYVQVGSHVQPTTLTVPVPAMSVNDTQRFGAALSYAKRYAFCAALNIVVSDEDDDAGRLMDTLTQEEASTVNELLAKKAVDRKRFLVWAEALTVQDMLRSKYDQAVDYLRRKEDRAEVQP